MSHEIRTASAVLRPVEPGDLDELHAIFTHPDVRRYMWDDEIIARDVTASIVERSQEQFRTEGHGLWLARLQGAVPIAGFCGFWYFHEPPQLELLYGLAPVCWGRGLATELAQAMIRYGFDDLGFSRIIGSTDVPNVASCRVMERAGMRLLRRDEKTIFYVIDK